MKNLIYLSAVLFVLVLTGCTDVQRVDKDRRYMTTPNIVYVKDFPKTLALSNPTACDYGFEGVQDIIVEDSFLIADTGEKQKAWKIVNLNTNKYVTGLFDVGNGRDEFTFPPSVITVTNFYKKNDSLYADLFNMAKDRMLTINMSESIDKQKVCLKSIMGGLKNGVFSVIRLADHKYLVREISENRNQQNRDVRNIATGKTTTPQVLESLNEASLKNAKDVNLINLLSCGTVVSPQGRIVEAPLYLNYLNIYTLDGKFAKTICLGDELSDLDILTQKKIFDQKDMFSIVKAFDNFFGVIKIGQNYDEFITGKTDPPSILFFSYDGEPLAEVKLDVITTTFDIDTKHGMLYVVDCISGKIKKYDIRKSLGFLPITR